MSYRVVFIDWDKTLCFSRFWDVWKGGELNHKYEETQEKFWPDKKLVDDWMVGGKNSEEVSKIVSEIVGLEHEFVLDALVSSVQNMKVKKSILDKIKALRENDIKVVIATDNMDTFSRWTVPALGLASVFDGVLCSYDLKARKTFKDNTGRSLFFDDFITRHNLKPHESVLLDDSSENTIVNDFGIDYIMIEDDLEEQLDQLLLSA